MGEPTILDKAFHVIMTRLVETGQAPFYTELARLLGLSVGEVKRHSTTYSPPAYQDGCTREPITSYPSRRSTISPPNTGSP